MRWMLLAALTLFSWSQRPVLEARFIGNMAFAISDGRVTVMTDFPYESGYSRYMTYAASEIRSSTPATLSLITHRHGDHWKPELLVKTDWQVAGPIDVVAAVPAHRVLPLTGPTMFGPVRIEPIATPHARIGHYSYIVTWHDKRLYFSGDTEDAASLLEAGSLDVAFVSPWIYRAALRSGRALDVKRIVIYHHESGESVPECRERCVVPVQGDTLTIE